MGWTPMLREEISQEFARLDSDDIHCDVYAFAVSWNLDRAGLPHKLMQGTCYCQGSMIAPHVWIEFEDGYVLDFRLRYWTVDQDSVPHGVFIPDHWSVRYLGTEFDGNLPSLEYLCWATGNKVLDFDMTWVQNMYGSKSN